MKKIISILTSLLLIIALLPTGAFAENESNWISEANTDWYTGNESNTEFNISTPEQLAGLAKLVNDGTQNFSHKTINITADIDLNPDITFNEDGKYTGGQAKQWTPIGKSSNIRDNKNTFKGIFNGNNHTISGIYIDSNNNYVGLFSYTTSLYDSSTYKTTLSVLKHINVVNSYIKGKEYVGGICGNCYSELINCHFSGYVYGAPLVPSGGNVGGIAGYCNYHVFNCTNSGKVSGCGSVGGIIGEINGFIHISNCCNTGDISSTHDNCGGIVGCTGRNNNKFTHCYNHGNINGNDKIGGLLGNLGFTDDISYSYNTGNISGNKNVGGIAGNSKGYIDFCYSSSNVQGDSDFGALCGTQDNNNGNIKSSYYNKDISGSTIKGTSNIDDCDNIKGLTETQFKDSTFTDLSTELSENFNYINEKNNGFPVCKINETVYNSTIHNYKRILDIEEIAMSYNNGAYEFPQTLTITLCEDIKLNPDTTINQDGSYTGNAPHEFVPIGTQSLPYQGTFSGNGNIISGIYIDKSKSFQGLFGVCKNADISRVGIINSFFRGKYLVGSICGLADNTKISECYNTSIVRGEEQVGGICGSSQNNTTITSCYSRGNSIISWRNTGGILGMSYGSTTINDSYCESYLNGTDCKGIIGLATENTDTINNCYMNGDYTSATKLCPDNVTSNNCYIKTTDEMYNDNYTIQGMTKTENNLPYINNVGNVDYTFNTLSDTVKVTSAVGMNLNFPSLPQINGYDIFGWYNNNAFTGTTLIAMKIPSRDEKTFYLNKIAKKYNLTLDCNGGQLDTLLTEYTYGDTITLPKPTKTGYTFDGWYDGDTEVTSIIATDTGAKYLTAKWTAKKYNLSLNCNGGQLDTPLTEYTYGETITLPKPAKTDYSFDGWYEHEDLSGDKIVTIPLTQSGNKTYYAKWTENPGENTTNVVAPNGTQVDNFEDIFNNDKLVTENDKGVTSTDLADNKSVDIKITVTDKTKDDAEKSSDIITKANGMKVTKFFDITVQKTISKNNTLISTTKLVELPELITINIPLDSSLQGKESYSVFRYHEGNVDEITYISNADGENVKLASDGKTLQLQVKKFSTYAIGYTEKIVSDNNNSNTGTTVTPTNPNNSTNTNDKTNNTDTNKSDNPKTGNNIPVSLMILSGLSIAGYVFTKKKNK